MYSNGRSEWAKCERRLGHIRGMEVLSKFPPRSGCQWVHQAADFDAKLERHVVVSTGSGTGTALAVFQNDVRPLLTASGLMENEDFRVHYTTSSTSVAELVGAELFPKANNGLKQAILLLSGDGGIVDVVNSLLAKQRSPSYQKPTISLLPVGTGNALANSSGLTGDDTLGLRAMLQGEPRELPLFRVTFSPEARLLIDEGQRTVPLQSSVNGNPVAHGAVVCSWGHHAALVADSDTTEYRKFGAERFKMAAKEALFPSDNSPPHAYRGIVAVRRPGKDWESLQREEHGYVLVTFVNQLEAGFTISPDSKPLDGKLRLVCFGPLDGQGAMQVMSKAFDGGKHVEDEQVGYEEIDGLKIEFDEDDSRWRRVCIDGKIIVAGRWLEVSTDVEGVVDLVSPRT